jgi:hypothetical protein
MMLGVVVASNMCTLLCLAKLTCLFLCSFFYSPIERRTQVVGHILAMLGKPDGWLVTLCMGRIYCHTLCIVGVILGNVSAFVLGVSGAVIKGQIVTLA